MNPFSMNGVHIDHSTYSLLKTLIHRKDKQLAKDIKERSTEVDMLQETAEEKLKKRYAPFT